MLEIDCGSFIWGKIVVNNPTYFQLPANIRYFWKFFDNPTFAFSLLPMDPSNKWPTMYHQILKIVIFFTYIYHQIGVFKNPTRWPTPNPSYIIFIKLKFTRYNIIKKFNNSHNFFNSLQSKIISATEKLSILKIVDFLIIIEEKMC